MKRGAVLVRGAAAAIIIFAAGCAVLPSKSASDLQAPTAERDVLAEAAQAVEAAPWPKPEPVSFFSRITGGGGEARVTRADAVAAYLDSLGPQGGRFAQLEAHADANLMAAQRLDQAARQAVDAPRLAMNDVVLIEEAIQTLREHRDIYASTAKEIARSGELVDDERLDDLHKRYDAAVKTLSETADLLAERIEHDRSSTFAAPDKTIRRNLSDL